MEPPQVGQNSTPAFCMSLQQGTQRANSLMVHMHPVWQELLAGASFRTLLSRDKGRSHWPQRSVTVSGVAASSSSPSSSMLAVRPSVRPSVSQSVSGFVARRAHAGGQGEAREAAVGPLTLQLSFAQ